MLMQGMRRIMMQTKKRKGKVTAVVVQHSDGIHVFNRVRASSGYAFVVIADSEMPFPVLCRRPISTIAVYYRRSVVVASSCCCVGFGSGTSSELGTALLLTACSSSSRPTVNCATPLVRVQVLRPVSPVYRHPQI